MKTTYDDFIDSYASDLSKAIKQFKQINVDEVSEQDLEKAKNKIDSIYDVGVGDKLVQFLYYPDDMTIRSLADIGLSNMNRYGTEMRQILNALEDFNNSLRKYLPDEEENEEE